jgi:soluble lytic murein transglycosylase-like protein
MKRIVILLLLSAFVFFELYVQYNKEQTPIKYEYVDVTKLCPPSLTVYYKTVQYTEEYNIEPYIGFGIVREETGYRSPFQWSYKPNQTSSANAYGSFQLLLSTARWFSKDYSITKEDLLYDIDLNTKLGLGYAKSKYDDYGNWKYALGYYNTGYPKINGYALDIYHNNK